MKRAAVFLAVSALLAAVCAAQEAPSALEVFVSIPPQKYFVERVGGARVSVGVMVQPGQSPHTFEATPKQMAALARSRAYFSIGLPFEQRLLDKVAGADRPLAVVDTCARIERRAMTPEELGRHDDNEHADEHSKDPHVWLAPKLVKSQAAAIAAALARLDPPGAQEYRANLAAFEADLDGLDAEIAEALAPYALRRFLTFHPSFGYFADAYGLKQVSIEVEGREASARQLATIIRTAEREGIKVIFVEPQFSKRSAEAAAQAIGGKTVEVDPLAYDYMANMRTIARKIAAAFAAGQ